MKRPLPTFSIFHKFPNLFVAISMKRDGGMKIRYELDKDETTLKNREKFLRQYGITNGRVITAHLIQRDNIKLVSNKDAGKIIANTDSLITNQKRIFLAITTADCLPIFIFDSKKEAVALIHAGWRSLTLGILGKTIKQMRKNFGSIPGDLIIGIGPGIGICHFEVKEDVVSKLKQYRKAIQERNGKIFIDLKQIAFKQLVKEGVKQESIEINSDCTYHEEEKYFSYRRDKTLPLQANLVVMGLN